MIDYEILFFTTRFISGQYGSGDGLEGPMDVEKTSSDQTVWTNNKRQHYGDEDPGRKLRKSPCVAFVSSSFASYRVLKHSKSR